MLLSPLFLLGQSENYRFVNFDAKDGLQDKVIYNCTQDKKGYMWFGTTTGLYRYDGHHFKYYRSPLDKAGSSIANVLQAVMCDSAGNIWLGSFTTLQWYNPSKNIFWEPDIRKPELKEMASAYFYNFSEGKYIWCSSSKHFVYRFNKEDSSFLSLAPNYPKSASSTSLYTVEDRGLLYDIHPEGIYMFKLDGSFVKHVPHPAADITNGEYVVGEKAIYLSTYVSGILRFDLSNTSIAVVFPEQQAFKKNYLFSVAKDEAGNYYVGATGLFISSAKHRAILDFTTGKKKNEFSFGGGKTVKIFTDREKNKWFCTHNGLTMLPWQNSQIKTFELKDEATGYITEAIAASQEPLSKNILLANTSARGLQVVDLGTEKLSTIPMPGSSFLDGERTMAIVQAPDSTLYAGGNEAFYNYNPAAKTLSVFPLKDQEGKPIRMVSRSVADRNGNIYIGSVDNGFYIWQYRSGKLTHYNKWDVIKTDTATNNNNLVPCIIDSKQHIWFTGSNGVYEFRPTDGKYYQRKPAEDSGLPIIGDSRFIAEDKNGHFWITTQTSGLFELYVEGGKEVWKNYTANSGIGLPTDYCNKIKASPVDSLLWINSTAGLLKFDPVQKKVISIITMQNGLSDVGFGYTFNVFPNNILAQLYYGSLNVIDLNTYQQNTFRPIVQFNSIKVLDQERVFTLDSNHREIKATNQENFLQFEFAALVFNNANQSQYAYMLEGADKDWIYSGQTNTASYSGLQPGKYTFKVKAANNDGFWGDETAVTIIIQPPFYLRWWFIAICGLLAAAAVYAWNRFRIQQVKKEENLKAAFQQQIGETEMKALRAQMNPHFIFNSLNSIQKYILKNEHFEASQYLTKFSRLIRLILDHSNQNTVLLSSELDMLKLYVEMESLRFDNKFDYQIIMEDNLQPDTLEIPSMLVQPYVENAIWHGLLHKETKGTLLLSFSRSKENNLTVTIEDDGIGREKAAELKSKQVLKKKSYGMQITEDRIAIINRIQKIQATSEIIDLKDAAGNPCGTKVVLTIPLKPLMT